MLKECVGVYDVSCYAVNESEASEDDVEDMFDENYVSPDNKKQILNGNRFRHLKENLDATNEKSPLVIS